MTYEILRKGGAAMTEKRNLQQSLEGAWKRVETAEDELLDAEDRWRECEQKLVDIRALCVDDRGALAAAIMMILNR